ncbi:hypothetical protein F5148DRAFT_1159329 [Russula earlei]|uniref:Uncharacterized protein n=1 Tax=Russula earlei TaxID=71964 RepID=A0ACC0UPC1_9AGAM|nr:hypothetical protein F5148DRAFT_1159329 [Russula earlei]
MEVWGVMRTCFLTSGMGASHPPGLEARSRGGVYGSVPFRYVASVCFDHAFLRPAGYGSPRVLGGVLGTAYLQDLNDRVSIIA